MSGRSDDDHEALRAAIGDPRLLESMILGLDRAVPPTPPRPSDPTTWPLDALALLGQNLRMSRAAPPPLAADAALPVAGPVLSEPATALLVRLVASMRDGDPLLRVLARLVARSGFELHPFSLPRLSHLVRHLPGRGLVGHWLQRILALQDAGAESDHALDEDDGDDWLIWTPARQELHLRGERERDPAAARGLVRENMTGQPAATRSRWIEALEVGLGADDREFLEGLVENDRAASVREVAERLLARLPGSAAHAARLDDLVGRIEPTRSMLGGLGGARFELRVPKSAQRSPAAWAAAHHGGVDLDALAERLGLDARKLARRASGPALATVVALAAVANETARPRDEVAAIFDAVVGEIDPEVVLSTLATRRPPQETVDLVLRALIRPGSWVELPPATELYGLVALAGGPLPDDLARALLDGRSVRQLVKALGADDPAGDDVARLEPLAALIPASEQPRFLSMLEGVALGHRERAQNLANLVLLLSATAP